MPGVVVLGVGNPLAGDDGVGLAALEQLRELWHLPDDVRLVDGATWGMNLLHVVEDAEALVIVDAIDHGATPGTPAVVERAELPRRLVAKLSPHQVDLHDVLALAELRGRLPERLVAFGLQPGDTTFGHGMTEQVAAGLPLLVRLVVGRLGRWGWWCREAEPACTS